MNDRYLLNALINIAAVQPTKDCTATDLSLAIGEMHRIALDAIRHALNQAQEPTK